jgi:hypothetical protein
MQEDRPFLDYGNALEIYSDGLARIDVLGHTVVFNGFRFQIPQEGGAPERVINLKIITPRSAIPDIMRQLATSFGGFVRQKAVERLRCCGMH